MRLKFGKIVSRLLPLLAAVLVLPMVNAQGFLVKPMSIETVAKRGTAYDVPFEITNVSPEAAQSADIALQFMGENENGWFAVDPDKATPEDVARFPQFLSWVKLDKKTVDLDPLKKAEVHLRFDIPATARGLYTGALTVQTRPNPKAPMSVVLRFLIPIIIQIEGSTVIRSAKVTTPVVKFSPPVQNNPAFVTLGVLTRNSGNGLIHVGGRIDLSAKVGENWLSVTSVTVDPRRVIPGGELLLSGKVSKRIPSGRYRVKADLRADGQALSRYEGELDVVGDPNAGAITPDASVISDPIRLPIDVVPASMRGGMVSFQNPTSDPVTIDFTTATPKGLAGLMMGNIKGDDLSGAAWTTVSPQSITIGPLQTRKVRISVALPEGAAQPAYYTQLVGTITRAGEAAGTTSTVIEALNKGIPGTPTMVQQSPMMLSKDAQGIYAVQAAYSNVGNVSIEPKGSFDVTDVTGLKTFLHVEATTDNSWLLPLGVARFSANLDGKALKPGTYALKGTCSFGDKNVTTVLVLKVTQTKTGVLMEIVDPAKPKSKPPVKASTPAKTKPAKA